VRDAKLRLAHGLSLFYQHGMQFLYHVTNE